MDDPGARLREGMRTCGAQRCPYCGSDDVVTGLKMNQSAEVGKIGLQHKKAIFVCSEQLRADLCRACGSVVRFFVKDTDHNWVTD